VIFDFAAVRSMFGGLGEVYKLELTFYKLEINVLVLYLILKVDDE